MFLAILALAGAIGSPAPAPTAWVPTLQLGEALPVDPAFVNQDGRAFRWHQLRGKSAVLAFIYTRCRETNECPATSAKFAEMQHQLPRGTRLLEITLDPAYDTPAVLRHYGKMFSQDPRYWTLATGEPQSVLEFARRFNVLVSPAREPGQLEHGEALVIFDAQQRLISITAGNDWQPHEALAEVREAQGEPSNAFDRLTLWFRNFGTACGAVLSSSEASVQPTLIALASACVIAFIGLGIFVVRQYF